MGINLTGIRPDLALKSVLDNQIELQKSATESAVIKIYAQGERPNKELDDEFIEILINGKIISQTKPAGLLRGSLAVVVFVRTYDDGSVFQYRIDSILKQLEERVTNVTADGFFFLVNLNNIITPTTINVATGYSTTILNLEWHTV